ARGLDIGSQDTGARSAAYAVPEVVSPNLSGSTRSRHRKTMGIFDSFRKEEVTGSKVLVGQLGTGKGTKFDDELKSDLRVYKRFYPAASGATFTSVAELRGA